MAKVVHSDMGGKHEPRCWCGVKMTFVGHGAYPYDCPARNNEPNAEVWEAVECGHHGWTHRPHGFTVGLEV
jgi:hypothetical protein